MVELDHQFSTGKPIEDSWTAILDLERLIPCVEGGRVLERTGPDRAKAEIKVKMGAMSMKFKGTVEVAERDEADAPGGAAGQVARGGRSGLRQRRRDVHARRRRRHDPHRRPDHAARRPRWARA